MSIGIAVVLPSAVLMVTDSRSSFPFEPWRRPDDTKTKLVELHDGLMLVEIGTDQVTRAAIALLDERLAHREVPADELAELLAETLRRAWDTTRFPPNLDLRNERAALLAGGISEGTPGVAAALCLYAGGGDTAFRREPFDFLMLGGEELDASARFETRLHEVRDGHGDAYSEDLFEAVLDAAGWTVRDVARTDPTVGGPIRFVVRRTDGTALRGVWSRAPVSERAR